MATAARITHLPTGVSVTAAERREPEANRQAAVFRLRTKLAIDHSALWADPPAPSKTWCSRRQGQRLVISATHEQFPALLAEAMAAVVREGGEVRLAADLLGVSASQLIKLLAKEPAALAKLNALRKDQGLTPLAR